MNAHILIVLICTISVIASNDNNPLDDDFIRKVNGMQNSWTAGRNFPKDTPLESLRRLCGVKNDPSGYKLPHRPPNELPSTPIPEDYDAREAYPNCPSIKEIRNQGACGSCWAFGAVEAMTDRICIHSNNSLQFHESAEDPLSCCLFCGDGCNGGYPNQVWKYWMEVGIVSGGPFGSYEGCFPYEIPNAVAVSKAGLDAPPCTKKCEPSYNKTWNQDKHFGASAYFVDPNVEAIQQEIYKNGPVNAGMEVYGDFLSYRSGIYKHTYGPFLGNHSIKMIGWGSDGGEDYWIVANSWGYGFGLNGFFKILRGVNECAIESYIVAGLPREI